MNEVEEPREEDEKPSITRITVSGFKSLARRQSVDIGPLTILAGANSSGKSSLIQAILLLKQTLEASYDPGPLLLNGPNVKFTSAGQFLSRTSPDKQTNAFEVGVRISGQADVTLRFEAAGAGDSTEPLRIEEMAYETQRGSRVVLRQGMASSEIVREVPLLRGIVENGGAALPEDADLEFEVTRNRCFLEPGLIFSKKKTTISYRLPPVQAADRCIREVVHLPGLRGNPEREYPVAAIGPSFPGTFEVYTASVISKWQGRNDAKIEELNRQLGRLGLTSRIASTRISDSEVELRVARITEGSDLVNIADVGFGVSQALPVLTALLVAEPGQFVYIEQPELHLHPRAQSAMARILADAALRGVRVVAETHSSLLILGVQTLVAEGKLDPSAVRLHWFERQGDGVTDVRSADLDKAGAFGDWPEDFGSVMLQAESRYLDAAEIHQSLK